MCAREFFANARRVVEGSRRSVGYASRSCLINVGPSSSRVLSIPDGEVEGIPGFLVSSPWVVTVLGDPRRNGEKNDAASNDDDDDDGDNDGDDGGDNEDEDENKDEDDDDDDGRRKIQNDTGCATTERGTSPERTRG